MTDQWLTDTARRILLATVDGDVDAISAGIVDIVEQRGGHGIGVLCATAADIVTRYGLGVTQGGEILTVPAVVDKHGLQVNPDTVPAHVAPLVWASRMVAAYANDDKATFLALFKVSVDESFDRHMDGVAALVSMAGDVLRVLERRQS